MIVRGARQVGKTWLMREFGRVAYKNTIYINMDHNEDMQMIFSGNLDTNRILADLELYAEEKISPEDTLIIFDEVQEIPNALASLKYFCENAPQYHIVCAGSLLGIALHPGTSFPVGKVDFLNLYPLNYSEFLIALGHEQYEKVLEEQEFERASEFSTKYIQWLRYYYYVGGMPEAVKEFAENRDFAQVRDIQKKILTAYEQDFSKHAPENIIPRIRMLWNSIPSQMAKENKKFLYGLIREGARAKEYESALLWLWDCGLIYQVGRVTAPRLPLRAYEDLKAFKIYLLDVGLLSCMSSLRQKTVVQGNALFTEFKGALTEQYVMQQLMAQGDMGIFYWANERGTNEVDFLVDDGEALVPIEVKAEENLRAKSLQAYCKKYQPEKAIRTAMSGYRKEEWFSNIPLYCIGQGQPPYSRQ